jgi:cytochrome bd-type quinol oxidase subunit 2
MEPKAIRAVAQQAPLSSGKNWLALLHATVGVSMLATFLLSGRYMRSHQPPMDSLDPARHAMFTSRHLYLLAVALVNLMLGAYVARAHGRGRRVLQLVGSTLVVLAAVLLATAFLVEAVWGQGRTAASSYGWYSLFAGSLLHFLVSLRRPATAS